MDDPEKKILNRQGSLSYIEQSLNMIPPPKQAAVTIYPGPKAGLGNMSKADLEIANRLEKLRRKDAEIPTEEEMASRLAQLKGLPQDYYTKPSSVSYRPPDKRTQVQKSEDLLKQVLEEVKLDSQLPKPEEEIEARLARLRGVEVPKCPKNAPHSPTLGSSAASNYESQDLDEIRQLMKEAEMEAFEDTKSSVNSLRDDKEISEAIGVVAKKNRRKQSKSVQKGSSTSSDEKYSAGDESEDGGTPRKCNEKEAKKEKEEVDRIVQMYTKEAEERREKKKRKRLMKKKCKDPSDKPSSDDDSDLSSSSLSTSESEKLSSESD